MRGREVVNTKDCEMDCTMCSTTLCIDLFIYLFRSLGYHSQRQRKPFHWRTQRPPHRASSSVSSQMTKP